MYVQTVLYLHSSIHQAARQPIKQLNILRGLLGQLKIANVDDCKVLYSAPRPADPRGSALCSGIFRGYKIYTRTIARPSYVRI